MAAVPLFHIDGQRFNTLETFYDEICRVLQPSVFGRNLDALNDILYDLPQGAVVQWHSSNISRERLGFPETVRVLEKRLQTCHPSNQPHVLAELEDARARRGPTVFDWILEILESGVEVQLL